MPLILPGNVGSATAATTYSVANSCRFNRADSPDLQKTNGSSGNRKTWTFSAWIKRSNLTGVTMNFFSGGTDGDSSNYTRIQFNTDNDIYIAHVDSSSTTTEKQTDMKFRDPSAWYHIVWVLDTTQGTAGNREKLYVNGVQVTSFSTNTTPAQDYETTMNEDVGMFVGNQLGTWEFMGCYMAEVVFIDGLALAPTSFGEFDEDSPTIWKPIDVSGLTFGTNGFYLDFEDSANLGNDANGGTDFTETNLAATDQSADTPTLNYPTFNPLIKGNVATTLSEGNLKGVFGSGWSWLPATFGVQNGKWYWEAKVSATNDANLFIGITTEDQDWDDATPYDEAGTILYFADGRKSVDGTDTESHFASYTTNDIIGVALDLDSGTRTITFYKNNSVTPASSSAVTITSNFTGKFIMPVFVGNSSSAAANWELNFGSPPYANTSDAADANGYGAFEFAPPSGYIALNSKNLGSDGG